MKLSPTNLRILKKTRQQPKAGDIFVFQVDQRPDEYFFGRVVATDTKIGAVRDFEAVLIYLYKTTSFNKADIPPLLTSDLLVPPLGINKQPWTRGFFETVKSGVNQAEDLLSQHCFRDYRGWFFDEYGNRMPDPVEPVGVYGVGSVGSTDMEVSQALGLPLKMPLPNVASS